MRALELTGQKFGRLTALEEVDRYFGRIRWKCLCECGNKLIVQGTNLYTGKTTSCKSCNVRKREGYGSLVGHRFGRLTVISLDRVENKRAIWKCRCDCGNEIESKRYMLKSGNTSSCGCFWRAVVSLPDNLAAKKMVFRSYRANAKKRKLQFSLTLEEFVAIAEQDCHYCGSPPHRSIKSTVKGQHLAEDFVHNGIDRKDSQIGYISENCLPACFQCNYAKIDQPYEQFMEWIDRLVKYRKSQ